MLGLPGLFTFRAINVIAYSLGDQAGAFVKTAARLDRVLNILMAPVCGMVIAISASFAPASNPVRSLKAMRNAVRDRAALASPWMIGAMAGALGIALGGPRLNASEPWVGGDRARVTAGYRPGVIHKRRRLGDCGGCDSASGALYGGTLKVHSPICRSSPRWRATRKARRNIPSPAPR